MRSGRKKGGSGGNGRSGRAVRVVGLVLAGVVVRNSSAGFRKIQYVISFGSAHSNRTRHQTQNSSNSL